MGLESQWTRHATVCSGKRRCVSDRLSGKISGLRVKLLRQPVALRSIVSVVLAIGTLACSEAVTDSESIADLTGAVSDAGSNSDLVGTGDDLLERLESHFPDGMSRKQVEILSDDAVTLREYQDAFDIYHQCVRDGGYDFRNLKADPNTGEYNYGIPTQADHVVEPCYETHFKFVDMIFQSNPAITEQRNQQFAHQWQHQIHPCLEAHGIQGSPTSLRMDEMEVGSTDVKLFEQFLVLLQAGECDEFPWSLNDFTG